ncbi:MAG: twin-arginine translocation pathway signal protein, partial [Salaquimonas sp.]
LAPNPHNRQPWEVDLSKTDQAIIWRDKERNLPETDPFARQLTIGMGCFLELLKIAASQSGHKVDLDLFPDGEDGPVAIASFSEGAAPDPLFAHVMERRSCKEPFEDKAVPAEAISALADYADLHVDSEMVENLKSLTWEALKTEINLPRTLKESVDLFRIGKTEINTNPDGIDLGGPFLESLSVLGILTREANLDPNSAAFAEGVRMYETMLMATPAYAVIKTNGNNRIDQIDAGTRWLRLNLMTTSLGLALQPVSQALQEFPEMREHYQTAHALLAKPGETVQMLGRLGYGPQTGRTPRWPLETRLVNG